MKRSADLRPAIADDAAHADRGGEITLDELSKAVGKSPQRLRAMCREAGMPHRVETKGSIKRYLVKEREALAWMKENIADWRPVGGNRGGGRPSKKAGRGGRGGEASKKIPKRKNKQADEIDRIAQSLSAEDRADLISSLGGDAGGEEEFDENPDSLTLRKLLEMNPARVIQVKYSLESLLKKRELDHLEGRLVNASGVRRQWVMVCESARRQLEAAARTAAQQITTAWKLSKADKEKVRAIIDRQVEEAALILESITEEPDHGTR